MILNYHLQVEMALEGHTEVMHCYIIKLILCRGVELCMTGSNRMSDVYVLWLTGLVWPLGLGTRRFGSGIYLVVRVNQFSEGMMR
jgi:hypothetical protein